MEHKGLSDKDYRALLVGAKIKFMGNTEMAEALNAGIALLDAKAEGRLVVLPCKVGDTVYALQLKRITEFCVDPLHKEIVTAKVVEITLKDGIKWFRLYSADDRIAVYRGENFGKTVFLTREEAEKALEEVPNA
jgi:hypothetical protein